MAGRLLTTDISQSTKLSSLSWKARELFFYIIPHFNVHGKMNGDPHYIKGQCVPLLKHQTVKSIQESLKEITLKTNVVWYKCDKGLWWLKSLNFQEHQPGLRKDRSGPDIIPDPSGSYPGIIRREVEEEVEVEKEGEGEVKEGEKAPLSFTDDPQHPKTDKKHITPKELMESWNEFFAEEGLPLVRELSPKRLKNIRKRLKEHPEEEWWERVYNNIFKSKLLLGKVAGKNGNPPWNVTFDWLFLNDTNALKIYEGVYK